MKKRKINIELESDDNMWLTEVSVLDENLRSFAKIVCCPISQADNWQEVDEAYKTEWEQTHATDLSDAT